MTKRAARRVGTIALLVVVAAVVASSAIALSAWHRPIEPLASPQRFDRATVEGGMRLAAVGNCAGCHTTADGRPFAGGVPLRTPFGTIYGVNLTPDPERGIGRWPESAFVRAMREGVSRDGHLLYPAFPYDHFTHAGDGDLHALYAYLMTRDAAADQPPPNELPWPLRWRPLIAGWNLLFFRARHAADRPTDDGDGTARGGYLVDALGHCGGCHTPRNALGAEKRDRALAGNVIEGWYAPSLDAKSPSPIPWTVDALTRYLRTGVTDRHAMAGGPMHAVVANLANADERDVRSIAGAIVVVMGEPDARRRARAEASLQRARVPLASLGVPSDDAQLALGASVYAGACAECHDRGRDLSSDGALQLPLAVALYDDRPESLLRLVRDGIVPTDGEHGRWMPAFGHALSDDQLVALASYLRRVGAEAPPWPDLEKAVEETGR